jgi:hypothetical protein
MIDYEKDYEYANSRLNGTFVGVFDDNGEVNSYGYVDNIHYKGQATINELTKKGWAYRDLPFDLISTDPLKMGFINVKLKTDWVNRLPARHYKQGLNSENTQSLSGKFFDIYNLGLPLYNCLQNIYMPVDKVVEHIINGETKQLGITKNFMLGKTKDGIGLFHKFRNVGSCLGLSKDSYKNLQLSEDYSFLKEVLEGELNGVKN